MPIMRGKCGECPARSEFLQYVSTERVKEKTRTHTYLMFEHTLGLMQEV